MIIDSSITFKQALAQYPDKPAVPKDILKQLDLVDVVYFSFDHKLHRGQIVIHKDLVDEVKVMFELAVEIRFPFAKVVPNSPPMAGR